MPRFIALLFALALLFVASPAAAQVFADSDGDADGNQTLYMSSATTTTTAVGVALIVGTVVTLTPDEEAAQMERYLRDNAVALRTDLTLGAGPTVDDIATLLRVPDQDRSQFARQLRQRSDVLLELADPNKLNTFRAAGFLEIARIASSNEGRSESSST